MKKLIGCLFLSTTAFAQITVIPSVTMGAVTGSASLTTVGAIPYVTSSGVLGQDQTAGGQLFWDATNHRLGIGTASPLQRIHAVGNVLSDDGSASGKVVIGAVSNYPGIWFGTNTTTPSVTNYSFLFDASGPGGTIINAPPPSNISLRIGNVNAVTIAGATSSVGIGYSNTAPTGTLHIYDATATTGTTRTLWRAGAGDLGTDKILRGVLNNGTTESWNITRDGAITMGNGQQITTNTGSINNSLQIDDSGGNLIVRANASIPLRIQNVGYFIITGSSTAASVGVGFSNTTPTGTFHVFDNTAATGATSVTLRAGAGDATGAKLLRGLLNDGTTEKWSITRDGSATFSGATNSLAYQTATNCSSAASPAICSSAAAGSFVVAAAASTVTINTTAVTANSQILVLYDSSLGTKLGVTCNTTEPALYGVTARVAATSFTVTASAPVTNPACFSFFLIN